MSAATPNQAFEQARWHLDRASALLEAAIDAPPSREGVVVDLLVLADHWDSYADQLGRSSQLAVTLGICADAIRRRVEP